MPRQSFRSLKFEPLELFVSKRAHLIVFQHEEMKRSFPSTWQKPTCFEFCSRGRICREQIWCRPAGAEFYSGGLSDLAVKLENPGSRIGYGSKSNHQGTTGFSQCFHLPGCHFGYLFLTHNQFTSYPHRESPNIGLGGREALRAEKVRRVRLGSLVSLKGPHVPQRFLALVWCWAHEIGELQGTCFVLAIC